MKNQNSDQLINALGQCVAACEFCADACLNEGNVKNMVQCIQTDRDCADMCGIALIFISRGSTAIIPVLGLCIHLCETCAMECKKHDHDHCQQCAEACRECVTQCEAYKIR